MHARGDWCARGDHLLPPSLRRPKHRSESEARLPELCYAHFGSIAPLPFADFLQAIKCLASLAEPLEARLDSITEMRKTAVRDVGANLLSDHARQARSPLPQSRLTRAFTWRLGSPSCRRNWLLGKSRHCTSFTATSSSFRISRATRVGYRACDHASSQETAKSRPCSKQRSASAEAARAKN